MDGLTIGNASRYLDNQGRLGMQGTTDSMSRSGTASSLDAKSLRELPGVSGTGGAQEAAGGFAATLEQAIQSVNQLQKAADRGMQDLSTGRTDNVAEVMIAAEKADIGLKLMVQVRNKIIDAYQEIMKMQV